MNVEIGCERMVVTAETTSLAAAASTAATTTTHNNNDESAAALLSTEAAQTNSSSGITTNIYNNNTTANTTTNTNWDVDLMDLCRSCGKLNTELHDLFITNDDSGGGDGVCDSGSAGDEIAAPADTNNAINIAASSTAFNVESGSSASAAAIGSTTAAASAKATAQGQNNMENILQEMQIWQLRIKLSDGLSQRICSKCIAQFYIIHKFRRKCLKVQIRLRALYEERRLEEEQQLLVLNQKDTTTAAATSLNIPAELELGNDLINDNYGQPLSEVQLFETTAAAWNASGDATALSSSLNNETKTETEKETETIEIEVGAREEDEVEEELAEELQAQEEEAAGKQLVDLATSAAEAGEEENELVVSSIVNTAQSEDCLLNFNEELETAVDDLAENIDAEQRRENVGEAQTKYELSCDDDVTEQQDKLSAVLMEAQYLEDNSIPDAETEVPYENLNNVELIDSSFKTKATFVAEPAEDVKSIKTKLELELLKTVEENIERFNENNGRNEAAVSSECMEAPKTFEINELVQNETPSLLMTKEAHATKSELQKTKAKASETNADAGCGIAIKLTIEEDKSEQIQEHASGHVDDVEIKRRQCSNENINIEGSSTAELELRLKTAQKADNDINNLNNDDNADSSFVVGRTGTDASSSIIIKSTTEQCNEIALITKAALKEYAATTPALKTNTTTKSASSTIKSKNTQSETTKQKSKAHQKIGSAFSNLSTTTTRTTVSADTKKKLQKHLHSKAATEHADDKKKTTASSNKKGSGAQVELEVTNINADTAFSSSKNAAVASKSLSPDNDNEIYSNNDIPIQSVVIETATTAETATETRIPRTTTITESDNIQEQQTNETTEITYPVLQQQQQEPQEKKEEHVAKVSCLSTKHGRKFKWKSKEKRKRSVGHVKRDVLGNESVPGILEAQQQPQQRQIQTCYVRVRRLRANIIAEVGAATAKAEARVKPPPSMQSHCDENAMTSIAAIRAKATTTTMTTTRNATESELNVVAVAATSATAHNEHDNNRDNDDDGMSGGGDDLSKQQQKKSAAMATKDDNDHHVVPDENVAIEHATTILTKEDDFIKKRKYPYSEEQQQQLNIEIARKSPWKTKAEMKENLMLIESRRKSFNLLNVAVTSAETDCALFKFDKVHVNKSILNVTEKSCDVESVDTTKTTTCGGNVESLDVTVDNKLLCETEAADNLPSSSKKLRLERKEHGSNTPTTSSKLKSSSKKYDKVTERRSGRIKRVQKQGEEATEEQQEQPAEKKLALEIEQEAISTHIVSSESKTYIDKSEISVDGESKSISGESKTESKEVKTSHTNENNHPKVEKRKRGRPKLDKSKTRDEKATTADNDDASKTTEVAAGTIAEKAMTTKNIEIDFIAIVEDNQNKEDSKALSRVVMKDDVSKVSSGDTNKEDFKSLSGAAETEGSKAVTVETKKEGTNALSGPLNDDSKTLSDTLKEESKSLSIEKESEFKTLSIPLKDDSNVLSKTKKEHCKASSDDTKKESETEASESKMKEPIFTAAIVKATDIVREETSASTSAKKDIGVTSTKKRKDEHTFTKGGKKQKERSTAKTSSYHKKKKGSSTKSSDKKRDDASTKGHHRKVKKEETSTFKAAKKEEIVSDQNKADTSSTSQQRELKREDSIKYEKRTPTQNRKELEKEKMDTGNEMISSKTQSNQKNEMETHEPRATGKAQLMPSEVAKAVAGTAIEVVPSVSFVSAVQMASVVHVSSAAARKAQQQSKTNVITTNIKATTTDNAEDKSKENYCDNKESSTPTASAIQTKPPAIINETCNKSNEEEKADEGVQRESLILRIPLAALSERVRNSILEKRKSNANAAGKESSETKMIKTTTDEQEQQPPTTTRKAEQNFHKCATAADCSDIAAGAQQQENTTIDRATSSTIVDSSSSDDVESNIPTNVIVATATTPVTRKEMVIEMEVDNTNEQQSQQQQPLFNCSQNDSEQSDFHGFMHESDASDNNLSGSIVSMESQESIEMMRASVMHDGSTNDNTSADVKASSKIHDFINEFQTHCIDASEIEEVEDELEVRAYTQPHIQQQASPSISPAASLNTATTTALPPQQQQEEKYQQQLGSSSSQLLLSESNLSEMKYVESTLNGILNEMQDQHIYAPCDDSHADDFFNQSVYSPLSDPPETPTHSMYAESPGGAPSPYVQCKLQTEGDASNGGGASANNANDNVFTNNFPAYGDCFTEDSTQSELIGFQNDIPCFENIELASPSASNTPIHVVGASSGSAVGGNGFEGVTTGIQGSVDGFQRAIGGLQGAAVDLRDPAVEPKSSAVELQGSVVDLQGTNKNSNNSSSNATQTNTVQFLGFTDDNTTTLTDAMGMVCATSTGVQMHTPSYTTTSATATRVMPQLQVPGSTVFVEGENSNKEYAVDSATMQLTQLLNELQVHQQQQQQHHHQQLMQLNNESNQLTVSDNNSTHTAAPQLLTTKLVHQAGNGGGALTKTTTTTHLLATKMPVTQADMGNGNAGKLQFITLTHAPPGATVTTTDHQQLHIDNTALQQQMSVVETLSNGGKQQHHLYATNLQPPEMQWTATANARDGAGDAQQNSTTTTTTYYINASDLYQSNLITTTNAQSHAQIADNSASISAQLVAAANQQNQQQQQGELDKRSMDANENYIEGMQQQQQIMIVIPHELIRDQSVLNAAAGNVAGGCAATTQIFASQEQLNALSLQQAAAVRANTPQHQQQHQPQTVLVHTTPTHGAGGNNNNGGNVTAQTQFIATTASTPPTSSHHIYKFKSITSSPQNQQQQQEQQKVNLTCRFCHKRPKFTNNLDYSNHIIAMHPVETPFNCPHCPMHFTRRVKRQQHILEEHGAHRFQCAQCGQSFCAQRTLDLHLQRFHALEVTPQQQQQSMQATAQQQRQQQRYVRQQRVAWQQQEGQASPLVRVEDVHLHVSDEAGRDKKSIDLQLDGNQLAAEAATSNTKTNSKHQRILCCPDCDDSYDDSNANTAESSHHHHHHHHQNNHQHSQTPLSPAPPALHVTMPSPEQTEPDSTSTTTLRHFRKRRQSMNAASKSPTSSITAAASSSTSSSSTTIATTTTSSSSITADTDAAAVSAIAAAAAVAAANQAANELVTERILRTSHNCLFCEERFTNEIALRKHHQLAHSNQASMPFVCSICKRGFRMRTALQRHMETHDSEGRPYECSLCHVRFPRPSQLTLHKLTVHFLKRPHTCNECGKQFGTESALKTHAKFHGERKIDCDICGRKFFLMKDMRKHRRIHTGELFYKCDLCPTSFLHYTRLSAHMKSHLPLGIYMEEDAPILTAEQKQQIHQQQQQIHQQPQQQQHVTQTEEEEYEEEIEDQQLQEQQLLEDFELQQQQIEGEAISATINSP